MESWPTLLQRAVILGDCRQAEVEGDPRRAAKILPGGKRGEVRSDAIYNLQELKGVIDSGVGEQSSGG